MKTKITNYLENTSKHLFADDTSLYKIYTTGNTVRILKMDKDNIMNYSINTIDIDMYITWYGNNAKCVLKNELFPGYENKRSIKHFKTFKEFYSKLVENEKIAA